MKLVVLVENHESEKARGEHGLSVYIEYEGHKILLDAGTTDLLLENARILGVDLCAVDTAVLSHAHYDHSGGFEAFFRLNPRAQIYLQGSCGEDCYRKSASAADGWKYIGIPKGLLEDWGQRFKRVWGDREILPGVWLIAHHSMDMRQKGDLALMARLKKGVFETDDFSHEQSLVFETPKGLVIFNSCCHAGAAQVVSEVLQRFYGQSVYMLVGGFHMKDLYRQGEIKTIEEMGRALAALPVEQLYTGHCTGDEAFGILKDILGERLRPMHTGLILLTS